jgi:translation initiation factor IF-2
MTNSDIKKDLIKIPTQITVKDFSEKLQLNVSEILKKLMENGIMANINNLIDYETAFIVAEELGFEIEPEELTTTNDLLTFQKLQDILKLENEDKEKLEKRPPVVTILGHVDHGKTTLLDTLRKTRVTEGEFGGITQHTSAYQVKKNGELITFIDTPGHEAFHGMRERGASLADIAILVVAADDGVKPQTKEVIEFLLKNKIPTLVAINKIDKPEANVNKVKQELAEHNLLLEGYGGEVPFNEISAKQDIGLDDLLKNILFLAEYYDFRANPNRDALGIILESNKEANKGSLATTLIKTGTLKIGQMVIIGDDISKIKRMEDFTGKSIKEASPSTPVTIVGLSATPQSNDLIQVESDPKKLKRFVKEISQLKGKTGGKVGDMGSKELIMTINEARKNSLPIILKTDVQGTLEAIKQIIETIETFEVNIDFVSEGVGSITESDVKMAQTTQAVIYGFNVSATPIAQQGISAANLKLKIFNVIYELIEDLKSEVSDLLEVELKKVEIGRLKVLANFKNSKNLAVVGGKVMDGKMIKGEKVEVFRDKEFLGMGVITQLQHNKEDVSEVKSGLECGIAFQGKVKILPDDQLVCYKEEKINRKVK